MCLAWSYLSLTHTQGEDLDDGVLYQLISTRQQADEEVLAALRAVAAMSMDLTSPPAAAAAALASHPSLSAFLPAASKAQGRHTRAHTRTHTHTHAHAHTHAQTRLFTEVRLFRARHVIPI